VEGKRVKQAVLLIEDDRTIRDMATLLLQEGGLRVASVADGLHGLKRLTEENFDAVVLDLTLPTIDGLEVCRRIRQSSNIPILMLTARADADDVVAGLESGADDYVTKPFEPKVLLARVRALLRRTREDDRPDDGEAMAEIIRVQDLDVNVSAFSASLGGQPLNLTATEFRLLLELARRPGHLRTREALLEAVWGYDYLGDSRLVDMAIKRLRDKLGDDPRNPSYITTVRGAGYRLEQHRGGKHNR
jgi:two-component system response regulator MtrA